MEDKIDKLLGFEFRIDSVEKSTMSNGEDAFIIYLIVDNTTSKKRDISLSKATYVANNREQIEQDIWLSGYITGDDTLKRNSFKQAGIIFYTSKLKQTSENDILYISVNLPKEGTEFTVCFKNHNNSWDIIDIEKSEIEIKLTPKQIQKALLKKVERLEAFEEKLEVTFQNISTKIVNDSNDFTLFCELHTTNGTNIKDYIKIECILYDSDGLVLEKSSKSVNPDDFFGFEVIEFYKVGNADEVSKIRLYPKK